MDFERLYNKLESIDEKLDTHMLRTENRVTSLEQNHRSMSGKIKVILSLIVAGISAAAGAVIKLILR